MIDKTVEAVAEIRQEQIAIKARLDKFELEQHDFMTRTDVKLNKLLQESSEWVGVRKTLAALFLFIGMLGALLSWLFAQMFPHGIKGP